MEILYALYLLSFTPELQEYLINEGKNEIKHQRGPTSYSMPNANFPGDNRFIYFYHLERTCL